MITDVFVTLAEDCAAARTSGSQVRMPEALTPSRLEPKWLQFHFMDMIAFQLRSLCIDFRRIQELINKILGERGGGGRGLQPRISWQNVLGDWIRRKSI